LGEPGRIVSQLLIESLLLSVTGGVLGMILGVGLDTALVKFPSAGDFPLILSTSPDWADPQF